MESKESRRRTSLTETPGKLKMMQLNEKLVSLQAGMDEEKKARKDALSFKLKSLEEKANRLQLGDESKLNVRNT